MRGQFECGVWVCGVDKCAGAECGVRLNWGARTSLSHTKRLEQRG